MSGFIQCVALSYNYWHSSVYPFTGTTNLHLFAYLKYVISVLCWHTSGPVTIDSRGIELCLCLCCDTGSLCGGHGRTQRRHASQSTSSPSQLLPFPAPPLSSHPSLSSSHNVGTRFRPLSFQVPKPVFPIAGFPMVQHQIEACAKLAGCKEVLLLGYFQPWQELKTFLKAVQKDYNLSVR